ncbi:fumarylacetoacetate hydrolase family protein [Kushneria konosiri]|uniref:Isomerase/hydrolase n=1 Tax=Kushneria konosiri TaxID=698828 RepID=A0A2Z2HAH1_9GAMM|nr:fumarylacetoacetate hydrolase family protein [Kushneria konosiri]ARS54505.1 isomerase/hydrolase [Kushneria konosiri]
MAFQPVFTDRRTFDAPLGKIVCVGRNYAAHARELNNDVPTAPLLFIKPATSATSMRERIRVPRHLGEVHFETEVALLVSQRLCRARPEKVLEAIAGVGLALDLTLRDVQSRLKDKGHPWERAKGFDGACPLSDFVPFDPEHMDLDDLRFSLTIDGERRQTGHTALMLFKAAELLADMSHSFTLEPGDVILTGTPEGVGALPEGARLALTLDGYLDIAARS